MQVLASSFRYRFSDMVEIIQFAKHLFAEIRYIDHFIKEIHKKNPICSAFWIITFTSIVLPEVILMDAMNYERN